SAGGRTLMSVEACWKCDHRNVDGAKFCSACGTSLGRKGSFKSSLPTEYEQPAFAPIPTPMPTPMPSAASVAPRPDGTRDGTRDPTSAVPRRTSFGLGSRVLVQWSDGQRYPGEVAQLAPGQCLVLFSNGQHYWIDMRYVSPAQ